MRTRDSLRKKNSSQSSSRLPPKNSSVPSSVPVKDSTQAFIPRDNSLVESTDWSIQASPAVKSSGEEEKLTPSALPSNWNFNRLIDSLLENGGSPPLAYPNSRTSAPEIQPQTLPSDEVGLVQPAKESPGEINQVKSTPHVELGNKTVGTHPPHRQADIDSSQINERSNQQQVAQGVSYLGGVYLGDIELPNLPEKDPNFTWELLVKVLVEIFKFPSREYAEALLKYLGENQYPIRISYSIIIHTSNPGHEVLAIYAENQDAVSFYQNEANQALSQASSQAIQREYINPLNQFNSEIFKVATRENYIGELNQLSPEIRTQLDDFFNNLQETIKKDIENKATEIYGQVATIDDDVELYEAIIIQVLYEKFPTEFENIISGEVETPESPFNIGSEESPFNIGSEESRPEINIPIFDLPSGDNQTSEITISEQQITIPISELPFGYEPPSTGQIPTTNPGNNPASDSGQNSPQTTVTNQRSQLENLSPEIQSLLGGKESLPPENYEQLLNIGGNIQGFYPEEIQSYQVARQRFDWNLNQLQGSVNTYITVRDRLQGELQGQEYKQTLDSLLFGEISTPEKEKLDWWQLFKDLIASTLGSYKYAPEVLGELWAEVKAHWPLFVGTIVGLFIAEKAVVVLASAPEPTFLTKVAAVALQSFILAIYGVSIVVEGGNAAVALYEWFITALEAKGNPEKIEVAAKAFLRGIGHLLLVILGSQAFQKQISHDRLAALQAMLSRVKGTLQLPDGTPTLDLVYNPKTGSHEFVASQSPNSGGSGGNLLPSSSLPTVSIPQPQTPPSPGGSPLTTIGGGAGGGLSQIPPITEVPNPSVPGEITPTNPPTIPVPTNPSTVPVPVPTNPSGETLVAEPPQRLDIIPNLESPPTSPGLNPEPPGNVVKPGTEPVQEVTPGSGQTTSPPTSTRQPTNPNEKIPLRVVPPPSTTSPGEGNEGTVRQFSVINALGEVHQFKIFPDGTIIRCSSPCAELVESVRLLLKDMLVHPTDETIRSEANELLEMANQLAQDSKAKLKSEEEIIEELIPLETLISELELRSGGQENPASSPVVNVEALRETLGEEFFSQALLERGQDGLLELQQLMGLTSREGVKTLLDNGLKVERLIDVTKENGVLYVKLILELTQKPEIFDLKQTLEKVGVISIETAVGLLNKSSSEALEELKAIKQTQQDNIVEQGSIVTIAKDRVRREAERPDHLRTQGELARLQSEFRKENKKLKDLIQITDTINPAVNRIDTIINPRKWAELPCFAGETPVWTVNGVKRIDELQSGEKVWAFDEKLQQTVQREILKVLHNQTIHFYTVRVGSSTIQATGNHPFWVEDQGEWIATRHLKAGMKLKNINGQLSPIESIILTEGFHSTTYNLSIEEIHNYFVGPGVLVHNEGEVNYNLGGENYEVYIGKNQNYPKKIYVGITDLTLPVRLQGHHTEAKKNIKEIEAIPEAQRTPKQLADLEFYKFKLGIPKLELQAKGIKTKRMAEYIEENLVRFYEQEGQFKVTNREGGRRSPATMDSIARELANDADVQARGYCN